jgi:hypothetical protein
MRFSPKNRDGMEIESVSADEGARIRDGLWNDGISARSYESGGERYQAAVMDQWKLYVEMADRVSSRRGLANTFFLTLNTAVFTAIGIAGKQNPHVSPWLLMFALFAVLGECVAWWWIVRSYRQLNSAKFKVVGALEERLPSSPFWSAEWVALGEGRDWRKYLPLTHLEQWIPVLFGLIYLIGFILVVAN